MNNDSLKILPPLYLVGKKIHCWKCQSRIPAVAIIAPNIEGMDNQVCILFNITALPVEVLQYVQTRVPSFKLEYSKTVGNKYYANTCRNCKVLSGDFFLHAEPGGPFFPTDESEASNLYKIKIPIQGPISVQASCSIGTGDLILNNAKQIA